MWSLKDAEVSRQHARVYMQGAYYVIEDMGSTNGTSVNGQRLSGAHTLQPGEIITLGEKITLVYELIGTDVEATVATEIAPTPATMPSRGAASPPPMYAPPPPAYQPPPPAPAYQPPPAAPAYQPPAPAYQKHPPVPAFSPAPPVYQHQQYAPPAPEYMEEEPPYVEPVAAKKFPKWTIILIILVVLCMCAIVAIGILTLTPFGCSVYELFGLGCVSS